MCGECRIVNAATHPDWERPVPLQHFDLPPFPIAELPSTLRDFVEAEAEATQTPPDLAAMLCLAVVAAAAAKKVRVQVKEGYTEPVNLYTVTAMRSGERKSQVFADVVEPLAEHERLEVERTRPEIAQAAARRGIVERALQHAQGQAARARPEDVGLLQERAEDLARELSQMRVPAHPRYLVDDCTPERLSSLLCEQAGRIAVMSPEGGVFDIIRGRYAKNGEPNFDVFLKGYSGDALLVDRVQRGSEHVPSPALTMGLAVQPEVLAGLERAPGLRGRGLLARPLYSVPTSRVGTRKADSLPVPEHVRRSYADKLRAILNMECDLDGEGKVVPHVLALSTDAHGSWLHFSGEIEHGLGEHGALEPIADWGNKLAGAVVRIAGLFHVADLIGSGTLPWEVPISGETFLRAAAIGKYLIPHALAAFGLMGADPVLEDAKHLLSWIRRHSVLEFSVRDAFEGTKGRLRTVARLMPAMHVLEEHCCVRQQLPPEHGGRGRKPSPMYDVNPLVLARPEKPSQYSRNSYGTSDSANCANSAKETVMPEPATSWIDAPVREFETSAAEAHEIGEKEAFTVHSTHGVAAQVPLAAPTSSNGTCRLCKERNRYQHIDGRVMCGTCHPPVPSAVAAWVDA